MGPGTSARGANASAPDGSPLTPATSEGSAQTATRPAPVRQTSARRRAPSRPRPAMAAKANGSATTSPLAPPRDPAARHPVTPSIAGAAGPLPRAVSASQESTAYPRRIVHWPMARRSATKGFQMATTAATVWPVIPTGVCRRSRATGPSAAARRIAARMRIWATPAPTSCPSATAAASLGTARGAGVPTPSVNGVHSGTGDHGMS
ncbi:MAG: hypothetical protein IPH03_15595 [Tetrasphaera sp.]|nr:hypothetical protein [Tetrasphaera sp.]